MALDAAVTPATIEKARLVLVQQGCRIQRHKTGAAGLGVDPYGVPAYTVRRGRKIVAANITARELVSLAARAAGEDEADD